MTNKLLVIDAATEACSVALRIGENTFTRYEVCPQQHSQKLLPMVDSVLAEANVTLNELDVLGFGRGPGSFTGVRIGVSVAQGLAFGADLPVAGISNLHAMAQAAIARHPEEVADSAYIISVIDARMGEVYIAIYQTQNGLAQLKGEERVLKPEQAAEFIKQATHVQAGDAPKQSDIKLVGVGSGWAPYGEILSQDIHISTLSEVEFPNAEYMLPIIEQEFANGNIVSAEDAQPVYVRDTVTWKKLPGKE
ncbi:tRNA (adenosine(37)-N6)-threonylcarbamoyltransferase complex dimerization subunit type 1 TsaB [Flocculibacter collagenilyticus]|uniref:tRNA (adenosine(37)-N6)-threonylcarbamoyltransferase complex dimerization subunit type 1 TsaB n=1 Tax=Flocculibacter collagenilyticus TaxID=2744479 RepID=UPI0018F63FBC|nr:tRNA (adenosine(37)-N6)-threonylcarbamoyltransferase complex dimerization subunit type 1 TsaB [Flocculibacter collagenilyticus]